MIIKERSSFRVYLADHSQEGKGDKNDLKEELERSVMEMRGEGGGEMQTCPSVWGTVSRSALLLQTVLAPRGSFSLSLCLFRGLQFSHHAEEIQKKMHERFTSGKCPYSEAFVKNHSLHLQT